MKFIYIAFAFFFAFTTNATAGDYCNDPNNSPTDFCKAVRASEEALQKIRELNEKTRQIREELNRKLDEKLKEKPH